MRCSIDWEAGLAGWICMRAWEGVGRDLLEDAGGIPAPKILGGRDTVG